MKHLGRRTGLLCYYSLSVLLTVVLFLVSLDRVRILAELLGIGAKLSIVLPLLNCTPGLIAINYAAALGWGAVLSGSLSEHWGRDT